MRQQYEHKIAFFWITPNKGELGTLRAGTNEKRDIFTEIRRMEERIFIILPKVDKGIMEGEVIKVANDTHTAPAEGNDEAYASFPSASRYRVDGLRDLSRSRART